MTNQVKLFVVGAENYGSPMLRQTYKKGQSFEVDEATAEKMLQAVKLDVAKNAHPILARSGDPLVTRYERGDEEDSEETKKPATRKKRASKKASV